jgi:hypothetical protein
MVPMQIMLEPRTTNCILDSDEILLELTFSHSKGHVSCFKTQNFWPFKNQTQKLENQLQNHKVKNEKNKGIFNDLND